jgi:hypothetical protein
MLHRRLLALALTSFLFVPATSFAASATQDAYGGGGETGVEATTDNSGSDTKPSSTTKTATATPSATSTSSLPFTGLEAGLIAAAGLGLAGTGLVLRRAAREDN